MRLNDAGIGNVLAQGSERSCMGGGFQCKSSAGALVLEVLQKPAVGAVGGKLILGSKPRGVTIYGGKCPKGQADERTIEQEHALFWIIGVEVVFCI